LTIWLSGLAVFATVTAWGFAAEAQGAIKVSLRDGKGVAINGKVIAKLGSTVKECNSAAGTCTLKGLAAGKWTVTAKSGGGATGGPQTVTVQDGKTASITLTLKDPVTVTATVTAGSDSERTGATQLAGVKQTKDLGSGKVLRVAGTCRDEKGVLINGTVTVYQGSTVIGESKTAAGKYSIYDLAPGSYKLVFRTGGGKTKTVSVTVKDGQQASANFQF